MQITLALAVTALATGITDYFETYFQLRTFSIYLGAVAVISLTCVPVLTGLSMALINLAAIYFIIPPKMNYFLSEPKDAVHLLLFNIVGLGIGAMGARFRLSLSRERCLADNLAKAVDQRDEFLSIASHELKTPLSTLNLQLQLFRRRASRAELPLETIEQSLTAALKHVSSLTHLVTELLDIARIRMGKFPIEARLMDLNHLISEVASRFSLQASAAKCTIQLNLGASVVGVWDPIRIEQVLNNLISNAIKYAPGSPIIISTALKNGKVILGVEDFGSGIAEEDKDKIFERFEKFDTKIADGGFGIGLYVVKQIVELHGGTIKVDTKLGRGTKFIVELSLGGGVAKQKNLGHR